MSKVSQKKNLSSIQVIKTLQILLQDDYSMNDLVKKLNADEPFPIFNNSVISKYINTCRYIGISIPKVNNRYFVSSLPFGFKLDDIDINTIKTLQFIVSNKMTKKNNSIFDKFITKLSRHSKRNITTINQEEYIYSFELFEKAIAKKVKIRLLFKNQDKLDCIPLRISQEKNKTFFEVFNKRVRMIDTNRLAGIQILSENYIEPFNINQVAIFKLKGNLAKRYQARDNETVELNSDGTITVTNTDENKEVLLSRLMRYEDLCEIISPKTYRDEFLQMLVDTLKNYGK